MTRLLTLFVALAFSVMLSAQTQTGFVKTIGRPDKPSVMLQDVVIQVQGMTNPVISDSTGRFSISILNKKDGDPIVLLNVRKKGYELKDKDLTGRPLIVSSRVPIYISMVDLKQLEADRKRIEDKAYKVAEDNYQKKLESINQRLTDNEIDRERYVDELHSLQKQYEQYLSLISNMADRYARTDYDGLDSIDWQINYFIENGELDRADSLIRTVFDPTTVLERNRAAKQEILERIAFAQHVIDKASADREAILNDIKYAKELAIMCDNLANEYLAIEEVELAIPCLEKSLEIKAILYGEDSQETIATKQILQQLKP